MEASYYQRSYIAQKKNKLQRFSNIIIARLLKFWTNAQKLKLNIRLPNSLKFSTHYFEVECFVDSLE